MNRQEFLAVPEVIDFVRWAAQQLRNLPVNLEISRAGTGSANGSRGPGVVGAFNGLNEIVSAYHWRAVWIDTNGQEVFSGDWPSTRQSLNDLSQWIRYEVDRGSQEGALRASKAIVVWGGDRGHHRNPPAGAIPFLELLPDLPDYLATTRDALSLHNADTDDFHQVHKMNSMLTKVHALLAEDGLPIYDSRVAASIASLVEMYRQTLREPWQQIPEVLRFKAIDRDNRRRVLGLTGQQHQVAIQAVDPGVIIRGTTEQQILNCATEWASSKVRLGWLLSEVLDISQRQGQPIFANDTPLDQSLPAQMHTLEAGLFMIGFDVGCL